MLKITVSKPVSKAVGTSKIVLDPDGKYTQENLKALQKYFPNEIKEVKKKQNKEGGK